MERLIDIIGPILPALYAGTFFLYFANFFWEHKPANKLATPALLITAVTHFSYAVLRGVVYGHHPIVGAFEFLSVIALSLTVVYLVIELWRKNKSTGLFVLPFAFITQTISSVWIEPTWEINPVLKDTWFGVHTGTAMLSYAAFFISAIYGVMYHVFQRALRKKIFGRVFDRLPSLTVLFRMTYGAAVFGFIFLTFSIICGSIWAGAAIKGNYWLDPKVISVTAVWIIYGVALLSRYIFKRRGRLLVSILLMSFVLLVLSAIAARFFEAGWHRFGG